MKSVLYKLIILRYCIHVLYVSRKPKRQIRERHKHNVRARTTRSLCTHTTDEEQCNGWTERMNRETSDRLSLSIIYTVEFRFLRRLSSPKADVLGLPSHILEIGMPHTQFSHTHTRRECLLEIGICVLRDAQVGDSVILRGGPRE